MNDIAHIWMVVKLSAHHKLLAVAFYYPRSKLPVFREYSSSTKVCIVNYIPMNLIRCRKKYKLEYITEKIAGKQIQNDRYLNYE